jgi:hypothetical protein
VVEFEIREEIGSNFDFTVYFGKDCGKARDLLRISFFAGIIYLKIKNHLTLFHPHFCASRKITDLKVPLPTRSGHCSGRHFGAMGKIFAFK